MKKICICLCLAVLLLTLSTIGVGALSISIEPEIIEVDPIMPPESIAFFSVNEILNFVEASEDTSFDYLSFIDKYNKGPYPSFSANQDKAKEIVQNLSSRPLPIITDDVDGKFSSLIYTVNGIDFGSSASSIKYDHFTVLFHVNGISYNFTYVTKYKSNLAKLYNNAEDSNIVTKKIGQYSIDLYEHESYYEGVLESETFSSVMVRVYTTNPEEIELDAFEMVDYSEFIEYYEEGADGGTSLKFLHLIWIIPLGIVGVGAILYFSGGNTKKKQTNKEQAPNT